MPGPPFAFGAFLVLLALLVAIFIPESRPVSIVRSPTRRSVLAASERQRHLSGDLHLRHLTRHCYVDCEAYDSATTLTVTLLSCCVCVCRVVRKGSAHVQRGGLVVRSQLDNRGSFSSCTFIHSCFYDDNSSALLRHYITSVCVRV